MTDKKEDNNLLVAIDGSYLCYYIQFGAFAEFKKSSTEADRFSNPDDIDQNDLPDILNVQDFRNILHNFAMKRLETVNYILREHCQEDLDLADRIDIVCVLDDKLSHSFRKKEYAFYKAQRKLVKRCYDVQKVKEYILDVLFKELKVEEEHNWRFVKVENAEGDDVIATILTKIPGYKNKILIASDKDFLQIPDVKQFDMAGNEIKRIVRGTDEELSPRDFLLWKIIRGDVSDNISGVFKGYGEKKSLNLVHDRDVLKKMLKESQESAHQFYVNKFLMDFRNIPDELTNNIITEVKDKLKDVKKNNSVLNVCADECIDLDAL